MTPYREPAEIAKEIPEMPKEKEPWSLKKLVAVWIGACIVGLDASVVLIGWGHITVQAVGIISAIHFGLALFFGPIAIGELRS